MILDENCLASVAKEIIAMCNFIETSPFNVLSYYII